MTRDAVTELTIDSEFESLGWALTPEEQNLLEASLEAEGFRDWDPIIVWANHDDTILDGHNRYRICRQLGIAFKVKAIKLDTREDAINWIIAKQLSRRNSSDDHKSYLRGKRYRAEQNQQGGTGANQHTEQKGNACTSASTASRIAEETGVSERTVKSDAKFADHVDRIAKACGKKAKDLIVGVQELTRKQVADIAAIENAAERRAEFASAVADSGQPKPKQDKTLLEELERINEFAAKLKKKYPADVWPMIADRYRDVAGEFAA